MLPVCAVLGAGPGIGHCVAKKFLDLGYQIILVARNADKLADMQNKLGASNVSTMVLDVSDIEELKNSLSAIAKTHGDPEVLIFNAYSASPGKPTDLTPDALAESFRINVTAALAASQAVVPAMKKARKGTIIFTGGGFALNPLSSFTALSIGKAGLRTLANCLHRELKADGIHAGTVTICGTVKPNSPFDPDKIADKFIEFHLQPQNAFVPEIMFDAK